MAKVKHFPIKDSSGFRKNVADLMKDWDEDRVDSLMVSYRRKDASIRSYWFGTALEMMLLVKVFERDVIESHFPIESGYQHIYDGETESVEADTPETED